MPELSVHEINVAIARMMPGVPLWAKLLGGKPPYFWLENETTVMVKWAESEEGRIWSPATDLNQAAEAVRAICGNGPHANAIGAMRRRFAKHLCEIAGVEYEDYYTPVVCGPRAWCLALLAMEDNCD